MRGMIDVSRLNCLPEEHEFETAKYFADLGKDIVFIKESHIPGVRTPDIMMDGVEWEIKCPKGKGNNTITGNFKKAVKQSRYIVFDLRRCNVPESKAITQLQHEFECRIYLKRLLVIKKSGELLDFHKNN